MASNISEIFSHFFSRKPSKKGAEPVVKEEFNNQTFYRSKSGRYRSINKKRGKLSDDTFAPVQLSQPISAASAANSSQPADVSPSSATTTEASPIT